MRVILQRVTEASVDVDGAAHGAIGAGLVVLVGIEHRDTVEDVKWLANKVWNVRLWANEEGGKPWSASAKTLQHGLLVVSQFTLHARLKGNKPDFHGAMPPEKVSRKNASALWGALLRVGVFIARTRTRGRTCARTCLFVVHWLQVFRCVCSVGG